MFEYLKRLYDAGKLTADMLQRAVTDKGWITQQQYDEIVNNNQEGSA
ncbi:XkdX family protein [Paenibacillus oenotherae]|uniref:XkdX family protein n=1 Tax=Paenibacillus oenotherae TaxID=1435645 RepID=A0ABS7D8V8_9BACL|nr:XkdX family protein [Paenibacillus oenotherae]MBW7475962.1 XkdX family protein [Paenibacillus oenotherae]